MPIHYILHNYIVYKLEPDDIINSQLCHSHDMQYFIVA